MNNNDLVFKGLTRTALLLGVPSVPLIVGGMGILLIGVWFSYVLWLLLIPFYAVLYLLTMYNEKIFSVYKNGFKTFNFGTHKKYHNTISYSTKPKDRNIHAPKLSIYPLSKHPLLSEYIPYSTHITDDVILTKNQEYIATWAIDGVSFDMIDDDVLNNEKEALNNLVRSLSSEKVEIYVHSAMFSYEDKLDCDYESPYLKELATKYYKNLNEKKLFLSVKYITLVYNPYTTKSSLSLFSKSSLENREKAIIKNIGKMASLSKKVSSRLEHYGIKRLGIYEENSIKYSAVLEFFNFLIAGEFKKIKVLKSTIDNYITGGVTNLKFNKGLLKIDFCNRPSKYVKSLEIKEFCNETYIGILNKLLSSQITFILTQSFVPASKRESKKALTIQKGRLVGSKDDAKSQIDEITEALDLLVSDHISFGEYHFSIMVYADSIENVKDDAEQIATIFEELGMMTTYSDIAFPATYFAQFPSNTHLRPRSDLISSRNFSDFIGFYSFPHGKRDKNNWGEAIALINTPSNHPYYLNLHESEREDDFNKFTLGNSLVVGQAGSGKTAFLTFLLSIMMKYNKKSTFPSGMKDELKKFNGIYLDMKYGAMGTILCADGEYITLKNGEPTGFNPFMCEYTNANVRRIEILIKILIGNKVTLTPAMNQKISDAIHFIMSEFEQEDRIYPISLLLENIDEDVNEEKSIKSALKLWVKGEKYGWVFDNEEDSFLQHSNNLIGIDGTEILNDNDVKDAISYYIIWRVMEIMDGRRFGLWIDEAWKWIENDYISDAIKEKVKTNRSQNSFIILGVQSAEDFLRNKNARAFIEESSSLFLFHNPKAVKEDYVKGLSCSETEYEKIKSFIKSEYHFLIKRGDESVVATLDLSNMDKEYIKILSTDKADVPVLTDIFKENISHEEKIEKTKKYYREQK